MKTLTVIAAFLAFATQGSAQNNSADLGARLREVLPADVAERVIATVSDDMTRPSCLRALQDQDKVEPERMTANKKALLKRRMSP